MKESDVIRELTSSQILSSWHWFQWHLLHHVRGGSHPFINDIASAISEIDSAIPGYAKPTIVRIAAVSGAECHVPHYEQLLQILAEIHVIRQLVRIEWPRPREIRHEPVAPGSAKNLELAIRFSDVEVGFEVKAPSLADHINERATNPTQLVGRFLRKEQIEQLPDSVAGITYPRDNPIKDFLISANEKFSAFKTTQSNFYGVLVIVWDSFIYEPISALLHERGGLFKETSFYRDTSGRPVQFRSVDAVVVIPHLHQIMAASGDQPFRDGCTATFDFGLDGKFPQKAFIANPHGGGVPSDIPKALQAYTPSPEMGAEYGPKDLIWWL